MQSNFSHLDLGMQAIAQRALDAWAHLPDDAVSLSNRLLAKLSPPQWQLEWYLPRWLGESYGLSPATIDALVLANVTGLVYVCLQDKLVDEGFAAPSPTAPICLSAALHHQWIRIYQPLLAASSPFWHEFAAILDQWLHALAASNHMPAHDFTAVLAAEPGLLAHRAAPLKIGCAAAAYLAPRPTQLDPLYDVIDHLHVAAVLVDHVQDWREDLEAGRYNAFVHFASPYAQTPALREANRQQVHTQLFMGGAGHAYFAHALHYLDLARTQSANTGCPQLCEYLDWYRGTVMHARDALAASVLQVVDDAVLQIFGE